MGHSQSKPEGKTTVSEYRPDFEVVRVTEDPNYGRVKLIRENKTHQQMILKEFIFDTKQAFEQELKFFKERAAFDHPHMVQVIGYNATHTQHMCSTHYKVSVFIEILAKELETVLKERKRTNKDFAEYDVLLIAENVISALHHLQTKNMAHGDIRPVNIFFSAQSYKVTDPKLETDANANALIKAIINKTPTLLAPELLVKVPTGKFETKEDIAKADVFSLGATLLHVTTLKSSEDLYDYKSGKIDEHLLHDRLDEVRAKYSPFTFQLISDMLRIHEHDRPSFIELNDRIFPYQEAIHRRSDLPFLHQHEDPFGGKVQHGQGERAKRSALPVDHHHHDDVIVHTPQVDFHHVHHEPAHFHSLDTDDLDARIKAAIQRSQDTYKQVQLVDSQGVHQPHDHFVTSEFTQVRQQEQPHSRAPKPVLYEHEHEQPTQTRFVERSYDVHGHGGEHSVKSFQPGFEHSTTHYSQYQPATTFTTNYNVGGTTGFGHTGGEHVVRSTLPASLTAEQNAPRVSHDNVASFNYALGGSPQRQRSTLGQQSSPYRATYGQNPEYHFSAGTGYHEVAAPEVRYTDTGLHGIGANEFRHTDTGLSGLGGYQGIGGTEVRHTDTGLSGLGGYQGIGGTEVRHTDTERVVKAFRGVDDVSDVHRATYPTATTSHIGLTNVHGDYTQGGTAGYSYQAPAYESVHAAALQERHSHVAFHGEANDEEFLQDPTRYI